MIFGSLLLILVAVALIGFGLAQGSDFLLVGSVAASLLAAIALVVGARQAAAARAEGEEPTTRRRDRAATGGARASGTRARDDDDVADDESLAGGFGGRRPAASSYDSGPSYESSYEDPPGRSFDEDDSPFGEEPRRTSYTSDSGFARGGSRHRYDSLDPDEDRPTTPSVEEPSFERYAEAPRYTEPMASAIPIQAGVDDQYRDQFDDDEDPPDEPAQQLVSPAEAARISRMSAEVIVVDGRPRYHVTGCSHLTGRSIEALPVSEAVELGFSPCARCEPNNALLAAARRV